MKHIFLKYFKIISKIQQSFNIIQFQWLYYIYIYKILYNFNLYKYLFINYRIFLING